MSKQVMGRLHVERLSGSEPFHEGGRLLDFDVLDFWRWSSSNLVANTTRGILAEYIVARALGLPMDGPREEWSASDLKTADGIHIEVKSAAYVQTWSQTKLSTIKFGVSKRRGWDAETNKMEATPRRHADVYVLALLPHKDKTTIDPLNLDQWKFWALPTRVFDGRSRSQHSITLNSLRELAGEPVGFSSLAEAFNKAARRQKA